MFKKIRFMIAAPGSNSGKTTVTLGLMRCLGLEGFMVQAFKCGPDYLDTQLHAHACGRQSINLDIFMSSEKHVTTLFEKYASKADINIIEGVMGLYDGAVESKYSSASLAMLLDIPVVLVIDARGMAHSVAPMLYGFKNYNPRLKLAAVIFNHVQSQSHYQLLAKAASEVGVCPVGYLPNNNNIHVPSRHLGLKVSPNQQDIGLFDALSDHVRDHLDIDTLIKVTEARVSETVVCRQTLPTDHCAVEPNIIAIARDDAFYFTYHENVVAFQHWGVVQFFSPLQDEPIPEGATFVYIAGGYPELYLPALSKAHRFFDSLSRYVQQGGKLLAECGGMMVVGKSIADTQGIEFPMAGILPLSTSISPPRLHLGYRKFHFGSTTIKGHEFHYARIVQEEKIQSIGSVENAKGMQVDTQVFRYKNMLASWIHFYWADKVSDMMDVFGN